MIFKRSVNEAINLFLWEDFPAWAGTSLINLGTELPTGGFPGVRGYFCSTVGIVTEEQIRQHIANQ